MFLHRGVTCNLGSHKLNCVNSKYICCSPNPKQFSMWPYMWELNNKESWAPKNWCFWTVVLARLLRVLWTARRSNQSILKEISPGCSLEGLILKLKLQYFGHLMWRSDSSEKTLMLGKIEGRRRGQQRMRWLDGITDSASSKSWWWTGKPGVLQSMGLQRVGHDWVTELNCDLIWK